MAVSNAYAGAADALLCPSLGSLGHPETCALACKYSGKASGCKDGRLCVRCHICIWTRSQHKTKYANLSTLIKAPSAGVSTPDPPSVLNRNSESDESHVSLSASAMTPRGERKTVGVLEIATELHSRLCALQGQENIGIGMTDGGTTPKACGVPVQWQRDGVRSAQTESVGTEVAAAVVTPAPGVPPPGVLPLEEDVDAAVLPPPPVPVQGERFERYPNVVSAGSVGHPWSCAAACKYAGRKEGCRNGAKCAQCHQCRWQRSREVLAEDSEGRLLPGTRGHPQADGPVRRYAHRKGGCASGAGREGCHPCAWQREKTGAEAGPADPKESNAAAVAMAEGFASLPTRGFERADDDDSAESVRCFSVGSVGHPFLCSGKSCKYDGNPGGCKNGRYCLRCHLCSRRW